MTTSFQNPSEFKIAFFISPHGFGHAARAAGVMEAIYEIDASVRMEIFTKGLERFFKDSLSVPFTYHSLLTDIGLIQKTPLKEDLKKTVKNLNDFLPFEPFRIHSLADKIKKMKCQLIICDIAPMGIVVAQKAGIPSVLIENFTWDWVYRGYSGLNRDINDHANYLQKIFNSADHHIQTEPVCQHREAHLLTPPVCRKFKSRVEKIRKQLKIPIGKKVILITMGGIPQKYPFIDKLRNQPDVYFIIPGGSRSLEVSDNRVLLPFHSPFYHPDLVNAADAVIGKVGYSTLAEVYYAGVPFGYISRPNFRESKRLADFIDREMIGMAIAETDFHTARWLDRLDQLLALPRSRPSDPNGADQIANYVCKLLRYREII
jgi:UDP-N-acetylglucosamine:LPS N-acetylglucosamine transferase